MIDEYFTVISKIPRINFMTTPFFSHTPYNILERLRPHFKIKEGTDMEFVKVEPSIPLSELRKKADKYIEDMRYSSHFKRAFSFKWNQLVALAGEKGCNSYSTTLGTELLQRKSRNCHENYVNYCRTVHILNCLLLDTQVKLRLLPAKGAIPDAFAEVVNCFLEDCIENGNKAETIAEKELYVRKYCENLIACGCNSFDSINPDIILQAALMNPNSHSWRIERMFLRYLADADIVKINYAPLIPSWKKTFPLPKTYKKEELREVEASYDGDTARDCRNRLIVMIATRLLLRSGDIAHLLIDSVDLHSKRITIVQEKTGSPLSLPIDDELEELFDVYLKKYRPQSTEPYVFLSLRPPFHKIGNAAIYQIISQGFKTSNVDIGGHIIRASGATELINSGNSYSSVQKMLGHQDKNAIKHYTSIDIANLRKCALSAPPVKNDSFFSRFLNGGGIQ